MSKDADLDEEMAEMIASEIESLTEQLKAYEEKLKVQFLKLIQCSLVLFSFLFD